MRLKESMNALVKEIAHNDEEHISINVREALERGWTYKFNESLNEAKKKKENEIDRVCSRHYNDFLVSVDEIVKIKDSTDELTECIAELHENFKTTGDDLVSTLGDLEALNIERGKSMNALDAVLHCKELTKLMVRAKVQFEGIVGVDGNVDLAYVDYYGAMRSIEILKEEEKKINIPPLKLFLTNWLKVHSNKLLEVIRIDADTCITYCRGKVDLLGITLLRKQAILSTSSGTLINPNNENQSLEMLHFNTISLRHLIKFGKLFRLNRWMKLSDFEDLVPNNFSLLPPPEGEDLLKTTLKRLGPLHKALYMHAVLGEAIEFHNHYRSIRQVALLMLMDKAEAECTNYGLCAVFPTLCAAIAGFFGFESMIRRLVDQKDGAFSYSDISLLWENSCTSLSNIIKKYLLTIATPQQLILIREELLLLIETTSDASIGLKPFELNEIQRYLWDRFVEVQVDNIIDKCVAAIDVSQYQQMYVTDEELFRNSIKAFMLDSLPFDITSHNYGINNFFDNESAKNREISHNITSKAAANLDELEEDALNSSDIQVEAVKGKSGKFQAQSFPFSDIVPTITRQLHILVTRFAIFAVKNPHLKSKGETVCTSVQRVYDAICFTLERKLKSMGNDTPLSKAVQIAADATILANVSDTIWVLIEKLLAHFHWSESIDTDLPKTVALCKRQLWTLAMKAQDFISDLLCIKIDDLLSSFEFIELEPNVLPRTPHEVIEQLIDFLQVTLMCLTQLPDSSREVAHFACCTHISKYILKYLIGPKVPSFNANCIHAIDLDIKKLEAFADSCNTPKLRNCFNSLRDLIKCVLHPDIGKFGDNPQIMTDMFPKLIPVQLIAVLEKLAETPNWSIAKELKSKSTIKKIASKLTYKYIKK